MDPASGSMKYYDPNISVNIFYDRRPPGATQIKWLDKPPPQSLVGTVVYDSQDDDEDDDPYDIFAYPEHNGNEKKDNAVSVQETPDALQKKGSKYSTSIDETGQETGKSSVDLEMASGSEKQGFEQKVVVYKTATAATNRKVFRRASRVLPQKQLIASLGDDWAKHSFVPPDKRIARSLAKQSVFGSGDKDLWKTNTTSDLAELGLETQLYFRLLAHLFIAFLLLSILTLPLMVTFIHSPKLIVSDPLSTLTIISMVNEGNISTSNVSILGSSALLVTSYNFTIFNTVINLLVTGSFILFMMIFARSVNISDAANSSISITNYSVKVTGLPLGVTKKEVQKFFSDLFDPNKPGHLYDDGNRVIDENITIANNKELKEQLSKERMLKMEISAKERQNRNGKQIAFEARNSMDVRGDQLFAPHLKKIQWRSKRRIIHHDGSANQKQVFTSMFNCDNTGEPELYEGGFVAEVTFVYHDEGEVIARYVKRDRLLQRLYRLRAQAQKEASKRENCIKKIDEVQKEISKMRMMVEEEPVLGTDHDRIEDGEVCRVTAFVIFNHETSYMRCIEAYHNSDSACGRAYCQSKHLKFPTKDGDSVPLRVDPAPDPCEMLFENIGVPPNARRNRWCASCLGMLSVIVTTCGIIIASARVIGWMPLALFIVFANLVTVNIFIPIFVSWERMRTKTALSMSLMTKVFVCLFCNSAVSVLAAQFITKENAPGFSEKFELFSGAELTITVIMAADIVAPHIPNMFHAVVFKSKKGDSCISRMFSRLRTSYTQEEANLKFLGPAFQLPVRFATIFNTVAVSFIFACAVPVLPLLACITTGVSYWFDKYMLLRVCHQPPRHSYDSSDSKMAYIGKLFEVAPVVLLLQLVLGMFAVSFLDNQIGAKAPRENLSESEQFIEWVQSDHNFPIFIVLITILVLWIAVSCLNRIFGNCMTRLQLFCVNVICGGDDDHSKFFQLRRKKQSHGKHVHYLEESEEEEEQAQRYFSRHWLCRGATTCRYICRWFSLGRRRFGSYPAFTEPCILTLRRGNGMPETMPYDAYSVQDLLEDEYISDKEKHEGWRLGVEKHRRLIYKTKLWTSKGQAFRRRHDEHTQMYTYETLLDEKKPYTYSIHATSSYQQVLREQLFAKKALAKLREEQEVHGDNNPMKSEEAATPISLKEVKHQSNRKLLPHEMKIELPTWVKLFDSEHTAYYYLNQETGESSWDRPHEYESPRHAYAIRWLLLPRPRSALIIQQLVRSWLARRVYQKAIEREEQHQREQHDLEEAKRQKDELDNHEWRTHESEHMNKVHQMIENLKI